MIEHHMDTPLVNPDECAKLATSYSRRGDTFAAGNAAAAHHRSKAGWVLINGRWRPRRGIMRPT